MPKEVQVESSIIPEKVAGDIEARAIMEHAMASAAGLRLEQGGGVYGGGRRLLP